jgi:hypothetical protein
MPDFVKLLKREYVLASPQLVDFIRKVDTPEKNEAFLVDLKGKPYTVLRKIQENVELRLFDTAVLLVDERPDRPEDQLSVPFIFMFDTLFFHGKRAIYERYLWRQEESDFEHLRLPSYVLFDFSLKNYAAVVSDTQHTVLGRAWWLRMITKAYSKNLKVYAQNKGQLVKVEQDKFKLYEKLLWGVEDKFKDRLVIISNLLI